MGLTNSSVTVVLGAYITAKTVCTFSCNFCDNEQERESDSRSPRMSIARDLADEGWREITYDDTEGLACPTCVEKYGKGADQGD